MRFRTRMHAYTTPLKRHFQHVYAEYQNWPPHEVAKLDIGRKLATQEWWGKTSLI